MPRKSFFWVTPKFFSGENNARETSPATRTPAGNRPPGRPLSAGPGCAGGCPPPAAAPTPPSQPPPPVGGGGRHRARLGGTSYPRSAYVDPSSTTPNPRGPFWGPSDVPRRHPPATSTSDIHQRHRPATSPSDIHQRHPPATSTSDIPQRHPPATSPSRRMVPRMVSSDAGRSTRTLPPRLANFLGCRA